MSKPTPSTAPIPVDISCASSSHLVYKNCLKEYTDKVSVPMPVYQTTNEGSEHQSEYRSTVFVDGVVYASQKTYSHIKAAEQAVAREALICIKKKLRDEVCPLIHKDTVFCKCILHEYGAKMKLECPSYTTVELQGSKPSFISHVMFNGGTYSGNAAKSKKEAEQLAARSVLLSTLADDSGSAAELIEIIKSKSKLYASHYQVNSPSSGKGHQGSTGKGVVITENVRNKVDTADISFNKGKLVSSSVGINKLPIVVVQGPSSEQTGQYLVLPEHYLHSLEAPIVETAHATSPLSVSGPCSEQTPFVSLFTGEKHIQKKKKPRIDAPMKVPMASISCHAANER